MSFAKSKNDFSKKDMNFFSEFSSATSQQISSAFPFFLLATVAILVVTLLVWIICGIQVMNKQNKINDLRNQMADPKYQARLADKDKSQAEVEDLRNYLYVLTSLDSKVSGKSVAYVETLKAVRECMTDDMFLTGYRDTAGTVEIKGQTVRRESALNFLNLLKERDLFSFVVDTIEPFDPAELGYSRENLMFGNMGYSFTFTCTLRGHYTLSWASFIDGKTPTPLSELSTYSYGIGSTFQLQDIAKKNVDGVDYKLVNVKVNGKALSKEEVESIIAANEYSGKMSGNTTVDFLYTAVENGGES